MVRASAFAGDPQMQNLAYLATLPRAVDLGRCEALIAQFPPGLTRSAQGALLRAVMNEVIAQAYANLRQSDGDRVTAGRIMAAGAVMGLVTVRASDVHPVTSLKSERAVGSKGTRQSIAATWIVERGIASESQFRILEAECLEAFRNAYVCLAADESAVLELARQLNVGQFPTETVIPKEQRAWFDKHDFGFPRDELSAEQRLPSWENEYVRREYYVQEVRSALESGHVIINLWGEAGTGKTVLANLLTAELTPGHIITLRPTNTRILAGDIESALKSEGVESGVRTLAGVLADDPKSGAVIIDDVSNENQIWELVPEKPRVPVIVTSRRKLRAPGIACLEVHDFSEAEACAFIDGRLGNVRSSDASALASVLGYRPLALGHAIDFLLESPDVTIRELVRTLAVSRKTGLELMILPSQAADSLVRLYESVHNAVVARKDARRVLDTFLALTGAGGATFRDLVAVFMQSHLKRATTQSGLAQAFAHWRTTV